MSDTDTEDKPDRERLPSFEEFCERYFSADRQPTAWQQRLASRIMAAIEMADADRVGPMGEMHRLPGAIGYDEHQVLAGPGRPYRAQVGRSTVLAAIVSMLRDHDGGVKLLFTSRSEATAERRVEDMRAAVEELASAMLGRMPGTPVAAPSQPVLSAGDAARIVGLGQELAQYRKQAGVLPYDQPEGELLTWLERFLYPDVYVTELPVATDHHPSSGRD